MEGGGRKRVLFIAEAVTLAHVARATILARQLDPSVYEVALACDPRYAALFGDDMLRRYRIESISTADFMAALASGSPVYDHATLKRYAADDIEIIEAFDPAVVVGDFRLSLSASARVCRKRYITITNAGWSPYATPRFIVPDIPLTRMLGATVAQPLFDVGRPIAFAMHARPLNALRRSYGLDELPRDLRRTYTDADRVLYADVAELFPLKEAPGTHRHMGPVLWSPALADPSWANELPSDRPIVYVTLGSSGMRSLLPSIVAALRSLPCTVVIATAGPIELDHADNVFVAEYLDGARWTRRAALVICNGGSPSCYQALAEGVPMLGIPSNLDQYLNMGAVADAGAGILLRSGALSAPRIRRAASALLENDRFRDNARRLATAIDPHAPVAVLEAAIESLVAEST